MRFLLDTSSLETGDELRHLISYGRVEGIELDHPIVIEERDGLAIGIVGPNGSHHVSAGPPDQHRRLAALIHAADRRQDADAIARTLALAHIASLLKADGLVTSLAPAFASHSSLLGGVVLLSPGEALWMIGANIRLRDQVPLHGDPVLLQSRSEVFPMTAREILPLGQHWWAACVHGKGGASDVTAFASAVFIRLGQLLRARDELHEALRLGRRRAAILDALSHFDVMLTSSVGAFDALAHVAQLTFLGKSGGRDVAWQRRGWIKTLAETAPGLTGAVEAHTPMGAALRVIARTRNSIHGIPFDEFLDVRRTSHSIEVHHRAMLPVGLPNELAEVAGPLGDLSAYGVFLSQGTAYTNIGQFAEQVAAWSFEIVSTLQSEMLAAPQFGSNALGNAPEAERPERLLAARLAGIGSYPWRVSTRNLEATPSYKREIASILRRAEESIRTKRRSDS